MYMYTCVCSLYVHVYVHVQAAEQHCGGGGEAVWLVEGEGYEGEKGCVYVMGNFDNSLYGSLKGNFRCVCKLLLFEKINGRY